MKTINLIVDEGGARIDVWLSNKLEESRAFVQKIIDSSGVTVNGNTVKANYKMKVRDEIKVEIPDTQNLSLVAENIFIEVLYEDQDLIVINKPKGMVVHPAAGNYSGTLVNALLAHCGDTLSDINGVARPGIVHRIDKDTSGVLVVAKSNAAHEGLSNQFKEHSIKRVYMAVVDGVINETFGKIDAPIGRHQVDRRKMAVNLKNGRNAATHFEVLKRLESHTYISVTLETGRTHQIRVHMAYIGHPVTGDAVYGGSRGADASCKGAGVYASC